MKFRANIEHVQTFYRIIQAIEKLQKRCIIRFTEEEMHIICHESEDGLQCWSQIKQDSLFSAYRIQSNAENTITLQLAPEALLDALHAADRAAAGDAGAVMMRLAKHAGAAVLAFDIQLARTGGGGFGGGDGGGGGLGLGYGTRHGQLAKYVRVDVLRPQDVANIKEPLSTMPDVHVLLPPLAKIRTVTERMRTMGDVVGVHANHRGGLRLSVASDQVQVETTWTGLTNPNMTQEPSQEDEDPHEEPDPKHLFGVNISMRAFLKFLSSHVLNSKTIASICENCIILYVYIGKLSEAEGVLTFYIPGLLSGND